MAKISDVQFAHGDQWRIWVMVIETPSFRGFRGGDQAKKK